MRSRFGRQASYGAPIEVLSIDPLTGASTELADTSITNLLAELPALETQANGTSLFLQLADGTPVLFASTAGLATFLYSLAVQQMQATSFVTDNYNLDMQWLGTVDQPLLQEAVYWSERATAEASAAPERPWKTTPRPAWRCKSPPSRRPAGTTWR